MPSAFRGRALATLVQGIPINSSGSQVAASALSHATHLHHRMIFGDRTVPVPLTPVAAGIRSLAGQVPA